MAELDDLTPDQHRARYAALLASARERAGMPIPALATMPDGAVLSRETIPGGWYHTLHLPAGQALRLVNTGGTPGVSAMLWNAHEPTERFSAADTMKVQWTARIRGGRVLLSDMGRVLASLAGDTCGWHDALLGGSTPETNARHGLPLLRNTRENFIRAAGKHGLDARDIPACITFFAGVQTDAAGRFQWRGDVVHPGATVDLIAAMDLLVALSNCSHPLSATPPTAIDAIVWQPGSNADSAAREAGPEAARAFENTEAMHAR